ncbi:hypothetical protein P691DRAFT_786064, partial [Macrolepiota fuliginosa MF-IS2]
GGGGALGHRVFATASANEGLGGGPGLDDVDTAGADVTGRGGGVGMAGMGRGAGVCMAASLNTCVGAGGSMWISSSSEWGQVQGGGGDGDEGSEGIIEEVDVHLIIIGFFLLFGGFKRWEGESGGLICEADGIEFVAYLYLFFIQGL